MNRFLPQSLFGQTLLLLLAGLVVSHALGSWIYSLDRESAVRAVGGLATAQRIANAARLVDDVPAEWRRRLVAGLSDQSLQVTLTQKPTIAPASDPGPVVEAIRNYLTQQLKLTPSRQPIVLASENLEPPFGWGFGRGHGMGHGAMMYGLFQPLGLQVAVPLADGQWLAFATNLPVARTGFSRQFLTSMLVMAVFIIAISIWAARRLTAPLGTIARAAQKLGTDVNAPPLPENGTIEMRQAAQAFNDMQARLRALIENRTNMLAALSHDLRTPLTLLRLRAENVESVDERDKMLATIKGMDTMVGATLNFAREEAAVEPRRSTDISALVQSLVDDMADAGLDVVLAPAGPMLITCQPAALKRALTNLIDNAVKYGKRAHLSLHAMANSVEIIIDDDGPGIPEDEIERVTQPFYRVEGSRSRDTGGAGLGLAIAQSIVQVHGGSLTLSNRPKGGLRATLVLPILGS
ncbi:ATP-binding protein [Pseudorhodoplanes sinuspersici]|uniref:ATP-binding protein n=1 Tax=Pseudorhodoplanes sinuspersici TaxID=1235591 RepID=UPI000FF7DBDF|nr:ATP-binding protein [Pseudorhodoplanes sinuspersici]RKE65776.1 signal transduction histidine kinase [Pseudorhodoplanes sinuspersici]